jgi:L-lactate utilization protein LutC
LPSSAYYNTIKYDLEAKIREAASQKNAKKIMLTMGNQMGQLAFNS